MLKTEDKLFDEYKRVDAICRDIFSTQKGISQYIVEMEKNSFYGRSALPSWDGDYRRLKRTRWLRNQIAHEASATDCTDEDAAWLAEFHSRLIERRDPLALLAKVKRAQLNIPPQCEPQAGLEGKVSENTPLQKKENVFLRIVAMVFIGVAVAAALFIFHRIITT